MMIPNFYCQLRILGLIILFFSCTSALLPWYDPSVPFDERLHDLMAQMTLEEKIAQLDHDAPGIPRLGLPAYSYWSEAAHGVAWAGKATVFPAPIGMAATWNPDLVKEVGQAVALEGRAKHNAAKKPDNSTGTFYGLHFYAPNVNLVTHQHWGRAQETFGEDPYLSGVLGAAYVTGMQGDPQDKYLGVIATAKHYLAYNLDSDFPDGGSDPDIRLKFDATVTHADLVQTYTPQFARLVDAGVGSVMCSYNAVNGIPACASPFLQSDLRERLGFKGFVVSDLTAVGNIVEGHHYTHDFSDACGLALQAGVDLDLHDGAPELPYKIGLQVELQRGIITEDQIELAFYRVMYSRFKLGMFDPPNLVPLANATLEDVDSPATRALATTAAAESLVLLKNYANILPLKPYLKVAMVGPNADRPKALLSNYNGCSNFENPDIVDPSCKLVTPYQGVKEHLKALKKRSRGSRKARDGAAGVLYAKGCDISGDDTSGFAEAVKVAEEADVVIAVLGLSTCNTPPPKGPKYCQEGESHDRRVLGLPPIQQALLKQLVATKQPIVLVVMSGGPVVLDYATAVVHAIIQAWYPGEEGGTALAEILYGLRSPSGRLPVSLPSDLDPPQGYLDMRMNRPPGKTYRYFTFQPLYPFGFGLSYTKFSYQTTANSWFVSSGVSREEVLTKGPRHLVRHSEGQTAVQISLVVSNVGSVDSHDVLQLYMSCASPSCARPEQWMSIPKQELKAFQKVWVPAGKSVTVTLTVELKDVRLFSERGFYEVIKGEYIVEVGGCPPMASAGPLPPPLRGLIVID